MKLESAVLWWWLDILSYRRYSALKQVFENLDDALGAITPSLLSQLGLRPETVQRTLMRLQEFDAAKYLAAMKENNVTLLTIEDADYPARLAQIEDAPVFLSYKGNIRLLDRALIGVVGTRQMTSYGKRVVDLFVPALIRAHLTTVSGLALGIDSEVALASLRAGGETVAVLGNGLAKIYPSTNTRIAQDILKHNGLLLSEFPLDTSPDKFTFPSRNRIIAGLCEGTLVCEAPEHSGSVITAELALEYNREVFAVPGPIFEDNVSGCHTLIKSGQAHMVTTPDDVLRHLGVIAPAEKQRPPYQPQTPREISVYAVLTGMPQTVDDIIEKTGCSVADVTIALTMLQMADAARVLEGGMWVRR